MIRRAAALCPLVVCLPLYAQSARSTSHVPRAASDSIAISLLTFGPGEQLFDRFGHNAIRVRHTRTGVDSAYNWGMYSFDEPHFIWRFLTGDTRYWMQGFPTGDFVEYYRRAGRAVWEQDLLLAPAEAASLARFISWNAREENRFYRYDYYLDNCSTRVRDAIDRALGGAFRRSLSSGGSGVTYRTETLRLAAEFTAIDIAMDYALGPRADATLSPWEEMFIPMRVRDHVASVVIERADGTRGPLAGPVRVLVASDRFPERETPPPLWGPALAQGVTIAALALAFAAAAPRGAAARWSAGVIAAIWHLTAGAAGTLLLLAGLFTRHEFMGVNAGVLLGTPASLALAFIVPFAFRGRASERTRRAVRLLALIAAVVAVFAAVVSGVVPAARIGWAPLTLSLPAHLGIALSLHRSIGPSREGALAS